MFGETTLAACIAPRCYGRKPTVPGGHEIFGPFERLGDQDCGHSQISTAPLHGIVLSPNTLAECSLLPASACTWIRLVGGTWLLVATADSSSSTLLLFSVESLWSSQTRRPTAQAFLQGPVVNGLVDVSSDDGLIIALELRSPSSILEILSVRLQHESPAFVRLARYNGMSHLRAIQGSSIGFSLHNELSVPSILDWKTGEVYIFKPVPMQREAPLRWISAATG
ncbi:hypothetical protein BC629DRAFT_166112 [Irpex lacteus]|nr:hypothetical protein BC629DRAFT_166112 [Irpex lacteus]